MKNFLLFIRNLLRRPQAIFYAAGITSTIWFLVRVIPKPSRASYPCMRAAAPIMSGFVIYLAGLWGSAFAFRQARKSFSGNRYYHGFVFLFLIPVFLVIATTGDIRPSFAAQALVQDPPDGPNHPMGIAQGVLPGRVAWAYDRASTDSLCTNGPGHRYYREENYDQAIVDSMMRKSVLSITGALNIKDAWDSIFTYHNFRKSNQRRSYQPGETIFIKINQGTASWLSMNGTAYEAPDILSPSDDWKSVYAGACEASPPVALALMRQLVNEYGIEQQDILIGDPIAHIYKHNYDAWHAEFPDIKFMDQSGDYGRTILHQGTVASIHYSDLGTTMPDAVSDKLYKEMTDAAYMINIANLKPHLRAGITLCAKNHFGSHTRSGADHLHPSLIRPTADGVPTNTGYNKYRVQVDLMGNKFLGGNTMLFIVDGLWGGGPEEIKAPKKWKMLPFNNDWTSSIFMSLDQVALESVCFDFLRTEYNGVYEPETSPNWDGVDDYLHQAADKQNWPVGITYDPEQDGIELTSLGTHEHWQNSTTMAYSRNLHIGNGIELYRVPAVGSHFSTGIPNNEAGTRIEISCYPNPFAGSTEITYTLTRSSQVKVSIYDMNGRLIKCLADGSEPAGEMHHLWNAENESPGFYMGSVEITNQWEKFRKTIKLQITN